MREQLKEAVEKNARFESDQSEQLAEMRTLLATEKSAWDAERSSIVAQVSSLEMSKKQAEKDCDFFREQYGRASAYVTDVREENKELEKQAKISEEQARLGVDVVKATFELRVKTLEDDVKAWRRMAEFALEKDSRTNDDVRRRAAEELELRALTVRQKKSLKAAKMRIEDLEDDVEEKERMVSGLMGELETRKKENTRLRLDLDMALNKLDRIGSSQDDGHDYVYCCEWRMEGNEEMCAKVFMTMNVRCIVLFFFLGGWTDSFFRN